MGKRSRNKPEVIDQTREEQLAQIEKDYNSIKRMLFIGLIAVAALVVGLVLTRPGGYLTLVVILVVIEGISYPLLRKSLDRRREERIAAVHSGE